MILSCKLLFFFDSGTKTRWKPSIKISDVCYEIKIIYAFLTEI